MDRNSRGGRGGNRGGGFSRGGSSNGRGRGFGGGDRGAFRGGRGNDRGGRGRGGRGRGGHGGFNNSSKDATSTTPAAPTQPTKKPMNRQQAYIAKRDQLIEKGQTDAVLHAKVSHQLVTGLSHFKTKLQGFSFGSMMDHFFDWVPENFIVQQLPKEIHKFRSYLTRFHRGSTNSVIAFVKWVEWAQYENNKDTRYYPKKNGGSSTEAPKEGGDADATGDDKEAGAKRKRSGARMELVKAVASREHMRALLAMCNRHNSTKRKEGVRTLVNHLNHLCEDLDPNMADSVESLKASVNSVVPYALSRLVLEMVSEDFFRTVMHCDALCQVLQSTPITTGVILSLLTQEMSLNDRMNAFMAHQRQKEKKQKRQEHGQGMFPKGEVVDEDGDPYADEDADPDNLDDPTRGERNQRIAAIVFSIIAMLCSQKPLNRDQAKRVAQILCFCYVEHRGLRVVTANTLLTIIKSFPDLVGDQETWSWLNIAMFKFHKLDYLRPEAIQLLLLAANFQANGQADACKPPEIAHPDILNWFSADPLEPTTMEKIGSALFRKEHVTECHPAIHPVWNNIFQLISDRCTQGESMKVHLTNVVHNLVAPYRRGAADQPRVMLFRKLLDNISRLALLNADEFDRAELVQVASKTVGLGRGGKVSKPSDPATLRQMSVEELYGKVQSLIAQYSSIKDSEPASYSSRSWIIKELRGVLGVPFHKGIDIPYVNDAVRLFFQQGLCSNSSKDAKNMNRCIFAFAECFTFSFVPKKGKARPQSSLSVEELMDTFLKAETAGKTRYQTCQQHAELFGGARAKLEEVLRGEDRSVLFYENADMKKMLLLLFLVLSVDDGTNEEAIARADSVVPDLIRFYQSGTLEQIPIFYDLMMALCSSSNAPMHVMPLMAVIRRLASGFIVKYCRFINTKAPLDILLGPLVEAFHTDERQALKYAMAEAGDDEEEEEDDEADGDGEEGDAAPKKKKGGADSDDEDATDVDDDSSSAADDDDDTSLDDEDEEEEFDEEEEEGATDVDDEESLADTDDMHADSDSDDEEGEEWAGEDSDGEFEEEEKPTEVYINHLKAMVRHKTDEDHQYPTDQTNRERSDVLRLVTLAGKVGSKLRSPTSVHVFQVLLGVVRGSLKDSEDTVFDSARSAVETMMLTRNRYFGYFCRSQDLEQLFGDIQTYMKKTERSLLQEALAKGRNTAIKGATIKRRLATLKRLCLSVMHYIGFLAQKNHANVEVQTLISEFWKTMFCERGWDMKVLVPHLKKDMHHFRHGFAWCFVNAAAEKALSLQEEDSARRAKTFIGAYALIEAFLPRLKGLPNDLRSAVGAQISNFFKALPIDKLFEVSHTMLFHYFHGLRMTLEYNSKVGLDTEWLKLLITRVTDDDSIQVTRASVMQCAKMERMLEMTEKIVNIKACTPLSVLHAQHQTAWRKKKQRFYKRAHVDRKNAMEAVLKARNIDPTYQERRLKKQRREELRSADRSTRQQLKTQWLETLSKEEREQRRKKMRVAKQERVATNRTRKEKLHVRREEAFDQWKQQKLAEAADAAE